VLPIWKIGILFWKFENSIAIRQVAKGILGLSSWKSEHSVSDMAIYTWEGIASALEIAPSGLENAPSALEIAPSALEIAPSGLENPTSHPKIWNIYAIIGTFKLSIAKKTLGLCDFCEN
jgi:hypothetical protein